jgi:hypothetical protein
MKRKTAADLILMLACMLLLAILLAPTQAKATGKPEIQTPAPAPTSSTSSAASQAKAAIDLSLTNSATGGQGGAGGLGGAGGNAAGGSVSQGHTYVLPAPAAAAPLPAGMCPQGDSSAYSVLWGLVSWASSTTRTEMACLDKVLAVLRETAPKPVPTVVNYLHDLPVPPAAPASAPVAAAVPACEKAPEAVKPKAAKVAKAEKKRAGTCG